MAYSDLVGVKTWKDGSDAYGTRPDQLMLTLYRKQGNDKVEMEGVEPEWSNLDTDEWTYTYRDLPDSDEEGNLYTYVVEETLPEPYELTQNLSNGFRLTNALTGEFDLQVVKAWRDGGKGVRPASIRIRLYANGQPTETYLTLEGTGDRWTGEIKGLTQYDADGALIEYTVQEMEGSLPSGYQVIYGAPATGDNPVFELANVTPGDLVLTKTVGGSGSLTKEFTFTFTLRMTPDAPELTDWYDYSLTRQDGTVVHGQIRSGESVTLRHNESIHIFKLPGDAVYLFTESDNAGYRVTQTATSGRVLSGETIEASFHNRKSGGGGGGGGDPRPDPKPAPTPEPEEVDIPETGQNWLLPILLGLGGILALGLGLFGRRKSDGPTPRN